MAECSEACVEKVAREDFANLCDDRDKYWNATTEQAHISVYLYY